MSINVTVSGNPVSINRGKMVTTSLPNPKEEFDRRRLMRLEQVRHQSKDIAENIRNKLRNEKTKQQSAYEKVGEAKLKNWQAKKLLELQDQYQEALGEIGLGHKDADQEELQDEIFLDNQESNKVAALERGRAAQQKLQVSRNEESLKKAKPLQRKKLTRDIENVRSGQISGLQKNQQNPFKKRTRRLSPSECDSDSENRVPELALLDEDGQSVTSLSEPEPRVPPTRIFKEAQTSPARFNNVPVKDTAAQTLICENLGFPVDTRISERIRNRTILNPEKLPCGKTQTCDHQCQCDLIKIPQEIPPSKRNSVTEPKKRTEDPDWNERTQKDRDYPHHRTPNEDYPKTSYDQLGRRPSNEDYFNSKTIEDSRAEEKDYSRERPKTIDGGRAQRQFAEDYAGERQKTIEGGRARRPSDEDYVQEPPKTIDVGRARRPSDDRRLHTIEESRAEDYSRAKTIEPRARRPTNEDHARPRPLDYNGRGRRPTDEVKTSAGGARRRLSDEDFAQRPKTNDDRWRDSEAEAIPAKPKTTLRPPPQRRGLPPNSRMPRSFAPPSKPPPDSVQYYDHPNRYSKQYVPTTNPVEKIPQDSVLISSPTFSEEDVREKMRQRELDAHARGQAALEKEKIQREYRELLRQLPALQKQERIAEIGSDRQRYHMSDSRLGEMERQRQNRLDNAYEELFVRGKPALVTLPKTADTNNGSQHSLNFASWDVDFTAPEAEAPPPSKADYERLPTRKTSSNPAVHRHKPNNAESTRSMHRQSSSDGALNRTRSDQLVELLANLKAQKNNLLREVQETLPKDPQVSSAPSSDDIKSKSTDFSRVKTKRKRAAEDLSTSSESLASSAKSSASLPSPVKKARSNKKILILQNMSTQTTPNVEVVAKKNEKCQKEECECQSDQSELCEIRIKFKDDKPEVTVNPLSMGKNLRIITEEKSVSSNQSDTPIEALKAPPTSLKSLPPKAPIKSTKAASQRGELSSRRSRQDGVPVELSTKSASTSNIITVKPPPSIPQKSTTSQRSSGRSREDRATSKPSKSSWSQHFSTTSTASTSYMDPPSISSSTQPSSIFTPSTINSTTGEDGRLDPRLLRYVKKLLERSHGSIENLAVSAASEVSTPSESVIDVTLNNPAHQLRNVIRYFNIDPVELQRQLAEEGDNRTVIEGSDSRTVIEGSDSRTVIEVNDSRTGLEENDSRTVIRDNTSEKVFKSCTELDGDWRTESDDFMQYAEIAASCTQKISDLTALIEKVRSEKKKMLEARPTSASERDYSTTSYLDLPAERHSGAEESSGSGQEDKLLQIDYGYAEKLKGLTSDEIADEMERIEQCDEDLLERLQRLLSDYGKANRRSPISNDNNPEDFIPLLDIQKLPKLTIDSKKRPPPSKGLLILNGNTTQAPHELSTIFEADSLLSTKLESPTKKDATASSVNSVKSALPSDPGSPKDLSSSSVNSVPDLLAEVAKSPNSSDDKSEMETMETMLISIGMDWAIPTLRKTRETLALNSSSDSASKSLRDFLSKISSSSSLSDMSLRVENRRTSTPVLGAAEVRKEQMNFLADSDISSVREHSGAMIREQTTEMSFELAEESSKGCDC